MPQTADERAEYMRKWAQLMSQEGPKEDSAVCILSNSPPEMNLLKDLGLKHFGERCIIDPYDASPETVTLLGGDLLRTMAERGRPPEGAVTSATQEWSAYEMWSFKNARVWSEGLRKELDKIGYTYDPEKLQVISCGMAWTGCLTKYSNFIPVCLGLTQPADVRADLSPQAGWPVKAEFVERISLGLNVYLFLFKTPRGRPMAHFTDGLRAVWEPEHVATVSVNPNKVQLVARSGGMHQVTKDGFTAVVSTGCNRSGLTILAADGFPYDEFRKVMSAATIESMQGYHHWISDVFPYQEPLTMEM